jgi:hypothetical protein
MIPAGTRFAGPHSHLRAQPCTVNQRLTQGYRDWIRPAIFDDQGVTHNILVFDFLC